MRAASPEDVGTTLALESGMGNQTNPADSIRNYWRYNIEKVRGKLAHLPEESPVRRHLEPKFSSISCRLESASDEDLNRGDWPPLFLLLVHRLDLNALVEFDCDLRQVVEASPHRDAAVGFLSAEPKSDREWAGGLFEIYVKSRLLKLQQESRATVRLDHTLPNRKETDARLEIGGRVIHLECTVITDSDEERAVWNRYLECRRQEESDVLVRPGPYDAPDGKGPGLDYDCLRFYAKIYDKLAPRFNLAESQLDDSTANVLLVSCVGWIGTLDAGSPSIGWALDELFASQPATSRTRPCSLQCWLDYNMRQGCFAPGDFNQMLRAPRRLGAVALFDRCLLRATRLNYNANCASRLAHKEVAALEEVLNVPPKWQCE